MNFTEKEVLNALSFVIEPDLKKDIVTLNLVNNIQINENTLAFNLQVNNPALHNKKRITD